MKPRSHPALRSTVAAALAAACLTHLGACRSSSPSRADPSFRGLEQTERAADPSAAADRPAAISGGSRIEWSELRPLLAEAAGAGILEEAILDRALRARAQAANITLTPQAVAAEEARLREVVTADASVSSAEAGVLIERFRDARGLGPARYRNLLERNALLRALVKDEITLAPEELDLAARLSFGDRVRARYFVSGSQSQTAGARASILQQPEGSLRSAAFSEAAVRESADATAPRGGLLDPISPIDPALPATVREALQSTSPGQLTPVLSLDVGYAFLLIEERIPGRAPTAAETADLERRVRTRKERIAMEQLARQLAAQERTTVFDPSLRWSWENRPGAADRER